MAQYWTFNNCGGTSYKGVNLSDAIQSALSYFGDGYIHSAKGQRPVIECYDDNTGDTYPLIGEFNESLDELEKRNQE